MYWIPVILILPYIIILLRIWRSLLKLKYYHHKSESSLFVSIIVPCRNEEKNLPLLLGDLMSQDYPSESFEVIVADDNSSDKTYMIASGFKGITNLFIVKNKGRGKKSAIRTAVNASSGQIIITTDADCRMKKEWLKTIVSFFIEHKPDMVLCPVQLENKPGLFGRFQELEFLSLQGITSGCAISNNPTMCNGANLAFTKNVYRNHTGNLHDNISSGDDIFFLFSLKKTPGSKIMWLESSDAMVTTSQSPSLKLFLQQRRRWISKGSAYTDSFTILLAIVTFVTNFLIISLLVAGISNTFLFTVLIVVLILKSIPDFLILSNTTARYGRSGLMRWFLPAALIYPLYILSVTIISIFPSSGQSFSSPSLKGI
jgi:cellulose synthase/poly-beta-1,6-N-acetylglucosamine synthase-like glycosyltransferase